MQISDIRDDDPELAQILARLPKPTYPLQEVIRGGPAKTTKVFAEMAAGRLVSHFCGSRRFERMVLSAGAVAADTRRDFDTAHVLSERYNKIDDTIAETPAMSFRGLRVKARLAQITCDEPTGWDATIALSMGADIERLAWGKAGHHECENS